MGLKKMINIKNIYCPKTLSLIYIIFVFIACSSQTIEPGVGIGKYVLGANEEICFINAEERNMLANKGLFFTFEDNRLTSIAITTSKFSTKEGVRVGDSVEQIKKKLTNQNISNVQIVKGDMLIELETEIIAFPGISYIIDENTIAAILVETNDEKKNR